MRPRAQAKRREEEERFKRSRSQMKMAHDNEQLFCPLLMTVRWNAGNLNSTNFFRPHFLGKACPLALVLLSLRGKWAKVWQTQKGTKPNAGVLASLATQAPHSVTKHIS